MATTDLSPRPARRLGAPVSKRVLPGFGLSLGISLFFISLVLLLPISGLVIRAAGMGWEQFWFVISDPRVVASYKVTALAALAASLFNCVFGLLMAWVLVRYDFPGKRLLDAIMDLPFALPTAVAGITLATLFAENGWYGQVLAQVGIEVAYTPLGIVVAMAFTSVPFVVRTVQPVLEELAPEDEEAAVSLGASDWTVFRRILFPMLWPAVVTGGALSFARSLGEYGAVIFIAGNSPYVSEVISLMIFVRLEEYDFPAASAIAAVVMGASLLLLLAINIWQGRYLRRLHGGSGMTPRPRRVGDSPLVRRSLIGLAVVLTVLLLFMPLVLIFVQALADGWAGYVRNILDEYTLHAIGLTLFVALLTVPLNMVFGVFLAWLVTRFRFPGRKVLATLIDIPFAVSPVVAGLLYLLLYGNNGWVGQWLGQYDIQLMFSWPGIVMVTVFVTCPFVARELIPLMQQQGREEEEAGVVLGASGWQLFRRITLPNIRWALLYGVILTNARAVGEFGAVSVVSGNIRGETNTLPLHVELLYQDYNAVGAFAASSLLAGIALITLAVKAIAEWRQSRI